MTKLGNVACLKISSSPLEEKERDSIFIDKEMSHGEGRVFGGIKEKEEKRNRKIRIEAYAKG